MTDKAQQFIDCLKDACQLLDDYPSVDLTTADSSLIDQPSKSFDLALLD